MSGVSHRVFNGDLVTMTPDEAEAFDAAIDVLKIILTNAGYPLTDFKSSFCDPHTVPAIGGTGHRVRWTAPGHTALTGSPYTPHALEGWLKSAGKHSSSISLRDVVDDLKAK